MFIDNGKVYYVFDILEELDVCCEVEKVAGNYSFCYDFFMCSSMCNSEMFVVDEVEKFLVVGIFYIICLKVFIDEIIMIQDSVWGEV